VPTGTHRFDLAADAAGRALAKHIPDPALPCDEDPPTRHERLSVEGEIEGFKRTEEMTGDEAHDMQSLETVVEFVRATGVDVFAPAIGNDHGTYKTVRRLDAQRVSDIWHRPQEAGREGHQGLFRSYLNEYGTSLAMAGASLTRCKVDDELKALFLAPAEVSNRIF
jgi:hypothetical protein